MKKNIILFLVLTLCLMFTSVSMAASNLTDINGTKYEEAVSNLVDLGVVNGYPDNTFMPNGAITRAEMTKMIIVATGNEGGNSLVNVSFLDIDNSNHWAKESIYAAASLGIVNGYPDNTFRPDGKVTYAEATAMVVRAMGNDDVVKASSETWPNNYISYAQSLKLYNGIDNFNADDNATRGNIAILLWNMLKMDNTSKDNNANDKETSSSNNIAVIYFSATGTTKRVAEYIKDATGGDLIEIEPKEKYTDADLNYNNSNSRSTKEQNDSSARPEISNDINTESYDVIYLGYPIWWGEAPKIILTFLDNHDLSGKTVIPFCTSGGSGISTSVKYFKNNYKNVNWLDGRRLSASQGEVTNWVNGLNY